jgi:tRNA G18 (ribose-2'-O)-methylase SpoU
MFLVWICNTHVGFINELYRFRHCEFIQIGGKYLKQIADKARKELEEKLADVFGKEIKGLSTELREILLDDMVTAFESRLNVLNNAIDKTAN